MDIETFLSRWNVGMVEGGPTREEHVSPSVRSRCAHGFRLAQGINNSASISCDTAYYSNEKHLAKFVRFNYHQLIGQTAFHKIATIRAAPR